MDGCFGVNKMWMWHDKNEQRRQNGMEEKEQNKSHQTMGSVNRPENESKELSNFTVFLYLFCSQFGIFHVDILNASSNNNGLTIQFYHWIMMH